MNKAKQIPKKKIGAVILAILFVASLGVTVAAIISPVVQYPFRAEPVNRFVLINAEPANGSTTFQTNGIPLNEPQQIRVTFQNPNNLRLDADLIVEITFNSSQPAQTGWAAVKVNGTQILNPSVEPNKLIFVKTDVVFAPNQQILFNIEITISQPTNNGLIRVYLSR